MYNKLALIVFYFLMCASGVAFSQTMFDNMEIPPPIIGNKGKVFIGQQRGIIYTNSNSLKPGTPIDSLVAGKELPAEFATTLLLSMPNKKKEPNLIVGLATYKASDGKERYGILRSTDLGSTWQLIKPNSLSDTTTLAVKVNYFQIPLKKFHWLNENIGYLYGVKGIWKTTDGGLNWEKIFKPSNSEYEVRALCFKDEMNGTAVLGILYANYFHTTTDGGKTWEYSDQYPSERSVLDLSYVNDEFRCFTFYRSQSYYNTYMYFVDKSSGRWGEQRTPISKEMTFMGEIFWLGRLRGWIIMRAGEIWYTPDGGRNWQEAQMPDTAKYQGLWGDADKKPIFGQSSDLLDDSLIVQAVSLRKRVGTQAQTIGLYYTASWAISSFNKELSSAPNEANTGSTSEFNIFPNPSISGLFRVSLPTKLNTSQINGNALIKIYTPLGEQIYTTELKMDNPINLDLSGFGGGSYVCEIIYGEKIFRKTIFKNS